MGEMKPLGELCQITLGQSPASSSYNQDGEGLPFFQGNADFGIDHPVARIWCTEPRKIAQPNDLLVSVRAPIGAVNVADCECCIGRGVASIRPKDSSLNPDYLRQCLNAMSDKLASLGTGSTFTAVGKTVLNAFEVPVYPIEEQKHIAQQFALLLQLKRVAEQMLAKADELIQSCFVEMFLDGVALPKKTIGELATDIRYGTSKKASDQGECTYLRMNNMTDDGHLDFSDVKYISLKDSELEKCMVSKGDVLFNRTNSREKVGKTAVFREEEPMVIAGYIIRVRLGLEMQGEYLSSFMNLQSTKKMLRSIAKGAVHQANINSKELAAVEVPVPSLALQNEFAKFVMQVESLKATTRQQLDRLNTLYDSLAQRYFAE